MKSTRIILGLVVVALCVAAIAYGLSRGSFTSEADQLAAREAKWENARKALAAGQADVAQRLANEIVVETPDFAPARLLLGEFALARNQPAEASEHFDAVKATAGSDYEVALLRGGVASLEDNRFGAAESRFQTLLARLPEQLDAHRELARLYTITGRRWQSRPHLEAIVRAGAFDVEQLLMLGDPDSVIDFSNDLARAQRRDPADPLPLVGLARIARKNGDHEQAFSLIRKALKANPDDLQARATLGQLLVENQPAEVAQWHAGLPSTAAQHPEILVVMAEHAESQDNPLEAIRCYAEAVKLHPNHRRAVYRLGHLLAAHGKAAEGQKFLDRAVLLDELIAVVDVLLRQRDSVSHLERAARITEQLGRPWEADAWYAILATLPGGSRFQDKRAELRSQVSAEAPFQADNPLQEFDWSAFPLPSWSSGTSAKPAETAESSGSGSDSLTGSVCFRDIASEVGLVFSYFSGDDPATAGWEIVHELGGGVGVLDYDRDGWPDLYFVQGRSWPIQQPAAATAEPQPTDRLVRNVGGTAADVTTRAWLEELDYGQGVAIGDYDNDGFADIYVANLGTNRLYRNLGDGTFLDVTDQAGIAGFRWTTSCAIADLNGDGWPDLFDVTYLAGDEPLSKRCIARGIQRACSPDQFSGEQDRLWLSQGDGRFVDTSSTAGITGSNGKGLGLLIADYQGQGRLGVFVANDGTPNHFYLNHVARGEPLSFVEQAVTSGLAVDGEGRSQACMGIAFDDLDHDGRWDLLVTNFHREGSTLYRQLSGELFEDGTNQAGLTAPSLPFTGFGAQFLDATLDGHPDLVVLNGHIEDLRHQDVPFKMRAQFFQNLGNGRFRELLAPEVGEYFARDQLGRALATLDWDRDGRPDLVATHLDHPAALLHNESSPSGHFLKIRLVGAQSSRDAIGTLVRIQTTDGRVFYKQLVAGDGFQASNERVLLFGLGDAEGIAELHVRWPSGQTNEWANLPTNRELVIGESGALTEIPQESTTP